MIDTRIHPAYMHFNQRFLHFIARRLSHAVMRVNMRSH
jgi:hypothetical protein